MDIHIDFVPGDFVWAMVENKPIEIQITEVEIYVRFDVTNKKPVYNEIYKCLAATDRYQFYRRDISKTKEELKEKVFGK